MKKEKDFLVHESSYIDDKVNIGAGSKIWHFCHIMTNSNIGRNCSLGQNVVVGPNVDIGNRVKIQNNVSVYEGVEIEDDVFLGPSCVFTNVINPRSRIQRREEFKKTKVSKGASIGANATIVCGNKLGKYCFVAAGATVTKDVPPFALVAGTPAKRIGWVSKEGGTLDENLICSISGNQYKRINDDQIEEK